MARSFTAQSLIQLPRLSASEASVLITQLLTAAATESKPLKGNLLPPPIERSRTRLTAAHVALDEVVAPQATGDTRAKSKADRVIDAAWAAGFSWLSGWCKLPIEKNPHLAEAQALLALVYPDALAFTKLPYRIEWQQSKLRLDAIERDGHARTFKQLGGASFLLNIIEAHAAYGLALGITVPVTIEAASEIRTRMLAALDDVRDYVNRVVAHAEPDVPGSEALAEALLLPLTAWEATHRAPTPDAPAPPATPA
jgi:hypothetical protein